MIQKSLALVTTFLIINADYMVIVTKDGKEYRPLLFGAIDSPDPSEYITCILDSEVPEMDMFGRVVHHKIHVSEVKWFKGSLSTSPVVFPEHHKKANNGTD